MSQRTAAIKSRTPIQLIPRAFGLWSSRHSEPFKKGVTMRASNRTCVYVVLATTVLIGCGSSDDEGRNASLNSEQNQHPSLKQALNATATAPPPALAAKIKTRTQPQNVPGGQSAPPTSTARATASTASSGMTGPVVTNPNGHRPGAGAAITLYRWDGANWINLGKKATTNASSVYTIRGLTAGYFYLAYAGQYFGGCEIGYFAVYGGYSQYFRARADTVHRVPVRMDFKGYVYC